MNEEKYQQLLIETLKLYLKVHGDQILENGFMKDIADDLLIQHEDLFDFLVKEKHILKVKKFARNYLVDDLIITAYKNDL